MGECQSICCDSEDKKITTSKKVSTIKKQTNIANEIIEKVTDIETQQPKEDEIAQILQKKAQIKKKYTKEDFQIDGQIGQGGFGTVFLVQLRQNIQKGITEKYAMKRIEKADLVKKRVTQNVKLEKEILAKFSNRFIVALVIAFQDDWHVYFVMQFAIGGDTYGLIKKYSPRIHEYKQLGEAAIRFLAACVILGLQYLHSHNIMYRDLKPENVLLFENGYAKLTDFGLAKKSINDDPKNKTVSGTQFYYAPQMILKLGYNKDVDLWTLGVYLFEMSVLQTPFQLKQINGNFKSKVLQAQKNRNWKNSNLSPQLKDLINGFLKYDSNARLGAKGRWDLIKGHDFFANFDWSALENQTMQSPFKRIVDKYPVKLTPIKKQVQRDKPVQGTKIQGWTFIKKEEQ